MMNPWTVALLTTVTHSASSSLFFSDVLPRDERLLRRKLYGMVDLQNHQGHGPVRYVYIPVTLLSP